MWCNVPELWYRLQSISEKRTVELSVLTQPEDLTDRKSIINSYYQALRYRNYQEFVHLQKLSKICPITEIIKDLSYNRNYPDLVHLQILSNICPITEIIQDLSFYWNYPGFVLLQKLSRICLITKKISEFVLLQKWSKIFGISLKCPVNEMYFCEMSCLLFCYIQNVFLLKFPTSSARM